MKYIGQKWVLNNEVYIISYITEGPKSKVVMISINHGVPITDPVECTLSRKLGKTTITEEDWKKISRQDLYYNQWEKYNKWKEYRPKVKDQGKHICINISIK